MPVKILQAGTAAKIIMRVIWTNLRRGLKSFECLGIKFPRRKSDGQIAPKVSVLGGQSYGSLKRVQSILPLRKFRDAEQIPQHRTMRAVSQCNFRYGLHFRITLLLMKRSKSIDGVHDFKNP